MKDKIIGVVGNGFVGGAVAKGFGSYGCNVRVYDISVEKRTHTLEDVLESDFVFVCLPSPMENADGSSSDLSYIFDFFNNQVIERSAYNPIYILKSTVPPGTTERIAHCDDRIKVVHNPEFLTAANAEKDFVNAERTVIGGRSEFTSEVHSLYKHYFPFTPCIEMSSDESETVKYACNVFLTLKVTFFNMLSEFCENFENETNRPIDYENMMEGVVTDSRIGDSHTNVPGPDGDYGYGGTCFPKDINSLIDSFDKFNVDSSLLRKSWDYNKKVRTNWDWESNPASVSSNRYNT
jgi:nucleotide sugar dehydrogenase